VRPIALALVTGASTGIGRATALRLAASGWTVLAGLRDLEAGERLERDAPAAGAGGRVIALSLDVTDAAQMAGAAELVEREASATSGGGLDALVNNAGVGMSGPLELVSAEELRRLFEVNTFAQLAVTQAMLPMLRRGRGRIVFVSSVGGRVAMAYSGAYAASKHALEAFADALRVELRDAGVQVALVEPGSVATPIWGKAREEVERASIPPDLQAQYGHVPAAMGRVIEKTARRGVTPELVAETIERALRARRMRARYLVGVDARAMLVAKRLLPDRVFDAVARLALGV
jgi:NAD(P)-dependent dehydrogenase (short-subunit alcohol dehydrogenase family)